MIRSFIALELSPEIVSVLRDVVADLKRLNLDGRAVNPDSIHLTLKFLGSVEPNLVPTIAASLRGVAAASAPFRLSLRGLGVFPNSRRPRVVWFGVDPSAPLRSLQRDIERAAHHFGFEPEARPFSPHVTLMRLKSDANSAALARYLRENEAKANAGELAVDEFVMFQSVLKPGGAEYTKLATFRLGSLGGSVARPS